MRHKCVLPAVWLIKKRQERLYCCPVILPVQTPFQCLQGEAGLQGVKEDSPPDLLLPIETNLPPSMSLVSISLPTILLISAVSRLLGYSQLEAEALAKNGTGEGRVKNKLFTTAQSQSYLLC